MQNLLKLTQAVIDHTISEKLTRHQLEARQLKKFRKLVAFVNERSPFYAHIIQKNQINIERCTPLDFPKITKADLLKNFDEIVTDSRISQKEILSFLSSSKNPGERFKNRFFVVHTSGSSGEIGYFVYASHEWFSSLSKLLKYKPFGFTRRIAFVGVIGGHYAGVSMTASIQHLMPKFLLDIQLFDANNSTQTIVNQLNRFQPDLIISYPSTLKRLAEQARSGNLHIKPRLIESGGEALCAGDRTFIETAFRARLVNVYASSENLIMGAGCSQAEGLFLFENDLIFELNEDHTCVTNLYNYTMPLIRYTMADQLILKEPSNRLPRLSSPYMNVKEVVGRSEQDLVLVNQRGEEDSIRYYILIEFFVQNLDRFQIKRINSSSFIFRMQPKPNLNDQQKQRLLQDIRHELNHLLDSKSMTNVQFSIEEVDSFSVNEKTGKFQLVVV